MRGGRRLAAALVVAALCAPGTWLRTEVSGFPNDIAVEQIAGASSIEAPGWGVAGVWEYSSEPNRYFGGFSAMLTLGDERLRAFSDRGSRFSFSEPDLPEGAREYRDVSIQLVAQPYANELWDIESATRDPATRDYWLGFEYVHAIHRFSISSEIEDVRLIGDDVDWTDNSGAEAMVRLADGRFVIIAEGTREALIYAGDPVSGIKPQTVPFASPAPGFVVTDLAQLPDGRVLMLMRNVVWGVPPFEALLAIADAPPQSSDRPWRAQIAFRFEGVIPQENYEGIAVRELADGKVAVWMISDDNFSVQQRTLLAKLLFDPAQTASD